MHNTVCVFHASNQSYIQYAHVLQCMHSHTHTHTHTPKHTAMSPSDMSLRTMVNRAAQGQETLEEYDEDMEEIVTPL